MVPLRMREQPVVITSRTPYPRLYGADAYLLIDRTNTFVGKKGRVFLKKSPTAALTSGEESEVPAESSVPLYTR